MISPSHRVAAVALGGCAITVVMALSVVGLVSAAAVAAGWGSVSGLLPNPGGFMLPVGSDIPAGSADFPVWAQPCGPEPGALSVDPSACTGSPSPYPADYEGFSTGQCTWYVATRRRVTWHTPSGELAGNAGQWLQLASADGYSVGPDPQIGAIAVYRDSGAGHVALVVGVDASGDYTVAEANWVFLGPRDPYVDLRGVAAGTTGSGFERLAGFIYGPPPPVLGAGGRLS
ncbi:MAG TPA: CHAP domain-containing protein [Candidatus Dormibacteraeota bacterium]|nr:CHAP domain-containing protein [Candidatus Dormibacteraeota bacterium]